MQQIQNQNLNYLFSWWRISVFSLFVFLVLDNNSLIEANNLSKLEYSDARVCILDTSSTWDTSGGESSIGTGKLSLCTGEPLLKGDCWIPPANHARCGILRWGQRRGYRSLSHQDTSSDQQHTFHWHNATFGPTFLPNSRYQKSTSGQRCFSSLYAFTRPCRYFPNFFSLKLLYSHPGGGNLGKTLRSCVNRASNKGSNIYIYISISF